MIDYILIYGSLPLRLIRTLPSQVLLEERAWLTEWKNEVEATRIGRAVRWCGGGVAASARVAGEATRSIRRRHRNLWEGSEGYEQYGIHPHPMFQYLAASPPVFSLYTDPQILYMA